MEITEIRKTKRGRFSLYIDGEFACVLHPEVYALSGLSVGGSIKEPELEQLRARSAEKRAREKALSLLARRSYTGEGLCAKLTEHTGDERAAAAAVARMQELGLVDDADYARRFAADCLNLKHYSLTRTARALCEKGIDRELIESVLSEVGFDPEAAAARIVKRRYLRYLGDEKGAMKTIAALQRLGYDYGDIRAVLRNLAEDPDYYEEYGD